ncbi:MAG: transporter [Chloroflexi bacterium]|nr:transporter [Chloroflexota bacterium]
MKEVAVIGVGMHPWGKYPDKTFVDLGVTAANAALKDAGVEWKDVQSVASGVYQWGGGAGIVSGQQLAAQMGERGIPITNISNMCATATSAFRMACLEVIAGASDIALAIGLDMSPIGFLPALSEDPKDIDFLRWRMIGLTNPGYWAMECRKRMDMYGTTKIHLAKAKALTSKYGKLNPYARYKREFNIEEVLNSPVVCDPLHLFMICATSDGAAAAVVCRAEIAKNFQSKPVYVSAATLGSSLFGDPTARLGLLAAPAKQEAPLLSESVSAANQAYKMAGIGPEDIDFVELPDNSSWHYLQYIESLGFCGPGEADGMLDRGETAIGGKLPVCPSGGIGAMGEAVNASGLAQICELVSQLRGQSGARQVEGAKVGMAQTYGMLGNSACAILKV